MATEKKNLSPGITKEMEDMIIAMKQNNLNLSAMDPIAAMDKLDEMKGRSSDPKIAYYKQNMLDSEQMAKFLVQRSWEDTMGKIKSGEFNDSDKWAYGDGDQSQLKEGRGSQVIRTLWGGDYSPESPHMSDWMKDCYSGDIAKVKAHFKRQPMLLDRRESLMRFNGLFHVLQGYRQLGSGESVLSVTPKRTTRHFECAKLLLEHGTDVDCRDVGGHTPLHHCTGQFGTDRSLKFAQYFLAQGADVNAKNRFGATPLFAPVMSNNYSCLDWLLDNGADPNLTDNDGTSVIKLTSLNQTLRERLTKYSLKKGKEERRMAQEKGTYRTCAVCSTKSELMKFYYGTFMKRCTGCYLVWYCSAECQRAGWKDHRRDCKKTQSEYISVKLAQANYSTNYSNVDKSPISHFTPKDGGKISGKQHFIVKVQIPLRGDDQDMLVYNKEKTVYGSITSQMSIYGDLQTVVREKGLMSAKGYFYAIWEDEKGIKINPHKIQPAESW